jgi:hypothetical protein
MVHVGSLLDEWMRAVILGGLSGLTDPHLEHTGRRKNCPRAPYSCQQMSAPAVRVAPRDGLGATAPLLGPEIQASASGASHARGDIWQ